MEEDDKMVVVERSEGNWGGPSGPIRPERLPTEILAPKHRKTIFTLWASHTHTSSPNHIFPPHLTTFTCFKACVYSSKHENCSPLKDTFGPLNSATGPSTELPLKRLCCIIQTACGLLFQWEKINSSPSLCANKGQTSPAAASQCRARTWLFGGGGWKWSAGWFWPIKPEWSQQSKNSKEKIWFYGVGGGGGCLKKQAIKASSNDTSDCARFPKISTSQNRRAAAEEPCVDSLTEIWAVWQNNRR